LNRNRVVGPYQPQVAGLLAAVPSLRSGVNACRVPAAAWDFAYEKLAETWSPQQVSGYQRAEHLSRLSHETIYQRIHENKRSGGHLHLALGSTSNGASSAECESGAAPSPIRC